MLRKLFKRKPKRKPLPGLNTMIKAEAERITEEVDYVKYFATFSERLSEDFEHVTFRELADFESTVAKKYRKYHT